MADGETVLPWEVHSEEVVLTTRVFQVKQQEASSRLQPHIRGNFSVLDCPNWVNVIAMTANEEVVLIRQYRHGNGCITIEIPGGMADGDEDFVTAGLRELLEETGYAGEGAELIGVVAPNPAFQNNRCGTLLVRDCRRISEADLDEHEEIEVFTTPLSEVLSMIRRGEIDHALVVAAFQHLALREG